MSVSVLSAWVIWCCVASATGVARADDGINVDPDSAPAVEYALPLQDARAQGSAPTAGGAQPAASPNAAPAFGTGISSRRSSGERSRSADRAAARPAGVAAADARSIAAGEAGSGASSVLVSLVSVIAVLLAGAAVALALRRRSSTG